MSTSETRRRTHLVGVRLRADELAEVERRATDAGETVPGLLRRRGLEAPCDPPADPFGLTKVWRDGVWCGTCNRSTGVEVAVGYLGEHVATLGGCTHCQTGVCAPRSSPGRRTP